MPQLGAAVARERGARLRAKGEAARTAHFQALLGNRRSVLVEKPGFGHSQCFAPVTLETAATPGHIVPVIVTGHKEGRLTARIEQAAA
jgi:threonylcarbamoyladenosine tRNA methylthiotransferase MtaB